MLNTSHSHPLPLTSSSLAMSQSGHFNVPITTTTTTTTNSAATGDGTSTNSADPLQNLSTVLTRINSVQNFLNNSINTNTILSKTQMHIVSSEISSAIHQIIVNAAALISSSQFQPPNLPLINHPLTIAKNGSTSSISNDACYNNNNVDLKHEVSEDEINDDWEIIEIDSVELLAEHIHFCEICGKGFKRDANLRMHMRAHGDRFKSPEALVKPPEKFGAGEARRRRFSCPFAGCNRNKLSKKFRPLKSVVCVRNHFKRSHCPKMYACDRCNSKRFSVVADLKSHMKHCGERKWWCSCGTNFSRKDKLFGHMALFEGHMPAVMEDERDKGVLVMVDEDEGDFNGSVKEVELGINCEEKGLFEGLMEGFGSVENYYLQDLLDSPNGGLGSGMNWAL